MDQSTQLWHRDGVRPRAPFAGCLFALDRYASLATRVVRNERIGRGRVTSFRDARSSDSRHVRSSRCGEHTRFVRRVLRRTPAVVSRRTQGIEGLARDRSTKSDRDAYATDRSTPHRRGARVSSIEQEPSDSVQSATRHRSLATMRCRATSRRLSKRSVEGFIGVAKLSSRRNTRRNRNDGSLGSWTLEGRSQLRKETGRASVIERLLS